MSMSFVVYIMFNKLGTGKIALLGPLKILKFDTVVGGYINTMKTTFLFMF